MDVEARIQVNIDVHHLHLGLGGSRCRVRCRAMALSGSMGALIVPLAELQPPTTNAPTATQQIANVNTAVCVFIAPPEVPGRWGFPPGNDRTQRPG
jgi:hypothetical protein